jgi:hypothetical protein
VQNENLIWFAYKESTSFFAPPIRGVALNDRAFSRSHLNIWTDYPVREDGTGGSVVIDAQVNPFGNSMGLFRYDGSQWHSQWQSLSHVPLAIWQRLKMALLCGSQRQRTLDNPCSGNR